MSRPAVFQSVNWVSGYGYEFIYDLEPTVHLWHIVLEVPDQLSLGKCIKGD